MSAEAHTDERLAVIGSGTIACGLAATAARRGQVTMWARSDASAERAESAVHRVCQKLEDDDVRRPREGDHRPRRRR